MTTPQRRLLQGFGLGFLLLAGAMIALPLLGARGDRSRLAPGGIGGDSFESTDGPPPVLGESPAFSLINQRGDGFSNEALEGKVWVADFVFTRCVLVCPVLSRAMVRLQGATQEAGLADETRFVSFSVDPEHDTPEVLTAYAKRHGADTDGWTFLTGARDEIWSLIRDGFRLMVFETADDPVNPIAHTPRMVLVDRDGQIRGFYDGTATEDVERLERDLLALAETG